MPISGIMLITFLFAVILLISGWSDPMPADRRISFFAKNGYF